MQMIMSLIKITLIIFINRPFSIEGTKDNSLIWISFWERRDFVIAEYYFRLRFSGDGKCILARNGTERFPIGSINEPLRHN